MSIDIEALLGYIFGHDEQQPKEAKRPRKQYLLRRKPRRLRWTTEKPGKPGFYFIRHPETRVTKVVYLHYGESDDIRPDILRVDKAKDDADEGFFLCDVKTAYSWAGPIPMPEDE